MMLGNTDFAGRPANHLKNVSSRNYFERNVHNCASKRGTRTQLLFCVFATLITVATCKKCPQCFDKITRTDKVARLDCGHCLHLDCMTHHLNYLFQHQVWRDDPNKIVCLKTKCRKVMTRNDIQNYGSDKIFERYTAVVDESEQKSEHTPEAAAIDISQCQHLAQICPGDGCKELTFKEEKYGCSHMECPECRYQYCWLCNEDWHGHKYWTDDKNKVCNSHGERYAMFEPDMNTPWDGRNAWHNIIGEEVEVNYKGRWYNARIYPKIREGYPYATLGWKPDSKLSERRYNVETDDRDGTRKIQIPNCKPSAIRLRGQGSTHCGECDGAEELPCSKTHCTKGTTMGMHMHMTCTRPCTRCGSTPNHEFHNIRHLSTPWNDTTVITNGDDLMYLYVGAGAKDYDIYWDPVYVNNGVNNGIMFTSRTTGMHIRWNMKKKQWYVQSHDNSVFRPFANYAARRRLQRQSRDSLVRY